MQGVVGTQAQLQKMVLVDNFNILALGSEKMNRLDVNLSPVNKTVRCTFPWTV